MKNPRRRAATITELLTAVCFLGAASLVLIPSLRSTANRQNQVQCLSNLGRIAAASLTYAAEDPREQLSPLHRLAVLAAHANGFTGVWSYWTALPRTFGGVAATVAMPTSGGYVTVITDPEGPWADRPLNAYFAPQELTTVFRCPADVGYPKLPQDIRISSTLRWLRRKQPAFRALITWATATGRTPQDSYSVAAFHSQPAESPRVSRDMRLRPSPARPGRFFTPSRCSICGSTPPRTWCRTRFLTNYDSRAGTARSLPTTWPTAMDQHG